MSYTPILAVLVYVVRADRVLLVHRNARPGDAHLGKYNGLGGKVERDEDIVTTVVRELAEEAQIIPTSMRLRGTISWPGFGKEGEDWFGFVYIVDEFTGEPPARNEEGDLTWAEVAKLHELPMWEGDRYFLPLVFDDDPRAFHAVLPYTDGHPTGWSCTRL